MSATARSYAILAFVLILLGKLSGFVRDIVFTYYYGVSSVTDGYFLANSISSLLYIAVYASIPVIVVPLYSRILADTQNARSDIDLSRSVIFFLCLSLALTVLVIVWSAEIVQVFAAGASNEVRDLSRKYLRIMALTFGLSTIVGFLNALQSVQKRPLPSYIVPLVNNAVFCTGLMLLSDSHSLLEVLLLGVLAWLILALANAWSCRRFFVFRARHSFDSTTFKTLLWAFAPAALTFYLEQSNSYVGVYFASKLGDGAISILGYAGKLNLLFLSVFLVFLTATLFPRIAHFVVSEDHDGLAGYVHLSVRTIFLTALPIVVFMIFYAQPIVELLFQRGKFTETDTDSVAVVLAIILISLPFALGRDLLSRVFFSKGDTSKPLLTSLVALVFNLVLSLVSYEQFGLVGLAWSVSVATLASFVVAAFFLQRNFSIQLIGPNLLTFVAAALCMGPAVGLLFLLNEYLPKLWLLHSVPFAGCYIAGLCLFNVREPKLLVRWALRRMTS